MLNSDLDINGQMEQGENKLTLYVKLLPPIVSALRGLIEQAARENGWINEGSPDSFSWIDAEGWSNLGWNQLFFMYKRRYYSINVTMFDGDPIRPTEIFSTQEMFCNDLILTPCTVFVFLGDVNDELRSITVNDILNPRILVNCRNIILETGTNFLLNFEKQLQCLSKMYVTDKITYHSDIPLSDDDMSIDDFTSREFTHRDTVTRYLKFAFPIPIIKEIRNIFDQGHGVNFDQPLNEWEEITYQAMCYEDPIASFNMAYRLFYMGRIVPHFWIFLRNAQKGEIGEAELAFCELSIYGMVEDTRPEQGFERLRSLVEENPEISLTKSTLAHCYWQGLGTGADIDKAIGLFLETTNEPLSCLDLAMIYAFDEKFKNLNIAYKFLQDTVKLKYDERIISIKPIVLQYEPLNNEISARETHLLILLDLFASMGDKWSEDTRNAYLQKVDDANNISNTGEH